MELRVHPTLIPNACLISKVDGVLNAVMVEGDAVGPTMYTGPGAGAEATASSVISDIVEIARLRDAEPSERSAYLGIPMDKLTDTAVVDIDQCETSFYLRFSVQDKPGVLSQVTQLFSSANISVEAIQQKEAEDGQDATIVLATERAIESDLNAVKAQLQDLDVVSSTVVSIRVEDLD